MSRIIDMRGELLLKAMDGYSSHHHLQGAGAYCGGPITGRTACLFKNTQLLIEIQESCVINKKNA